MCTRMGLLAHVIFKFSRELEPTYRTLFLPFNATAKGESDMPISAARFAAVLHEIGPLGENQLRFLRAHYHAPCHAATAALLAQEAGYRNHGGINLQYGKLAESIRARLRLRRRPTQLSILVNFLRPPSVTNRHWVLVMRPEFARGLKLAKWV